MNVGSPPKDGRSRAPALADWSGLGNHAHAVQFYLDDAVLVDRVTRLVGPTVVLGGAAIVVATPAHRAAIARRLNALGLNVKVAREQGRYIALDAEATLKSLVRNGAVDERRFSKLAGRLLDAAAKAGHRGRVLAFGEVVALLWEQGRTDAAMRLEELWQDLAKVREIAVCCAYPLERFSGLRHATPFMQICSRHTHVFPAERAPTIP